jgi:hypothetical protein
MKAGSVSWGQMVNASPYGELYKADGVTLRTAQMTILATIPILSWITSTPTVCKKKTLFLVRSTQKARCLFGFLTTTNFHTSFQFYRFINGRSPGFCIAAQRDSDRTMQNIYNWQVDNLLMWNRTFALIS